MNKVLLTCISSTPSVNGGFVVKLQSTSDLVVTTAFGTKTQKSQLTYYIKLDTTVKPGFAAELDLSQFEIVERPFMLDVAATAANPAIGQAAVPAHQEEIMLKWLQIRKPQAA